MEKKNTGLIITIIVLGLLVVGLGSIVVYDKFVAKNETTDKKETKNNNSSNKTNDIDKITDEDLIGTYKHTEKQCYGDDDCAEYIISVTFSQNKQVSYEVTGGLLVIWDGTYSVTDDVINFHFTSTHSQTIDIKEMGKIVDKNTIEYGTADQKIILKKSRFFFCNNILCVFYNYVNQIYLIFYFN